MHHMLHNEWRDVNLYQRTSVLIPLKLASREGEDLIRCKELLCAYLMQNNRKTFKTK